MTLELKPRGSYERTVPDYKAHDESEIATEAETDTGLANEADPHGNGTEAGPQCVVRE